MFPASNSTLYYEQAKNQLSALAKEKVYDVPLRLVGLFEEKDTTVSAIWTEYSSSRYSRTVINRSTCQFRIHLPRTSRSRASIIQV